MKVAPNRKLLPPCLSIVGIALLSYVAGAAVIFWRLPSSEWLTRAFLGALSSHEHPKTPAATAHEPEKAPIPVTRDVDRPEKTFDGYTLYSCIADKASGTQAFLVNMQREVVHRWAIRSNQLWPSEVGAGHHENSVCFFATYLYPNGDLLAVCQGWDSRDCGLAKLDAASNLIWFRPRSIHHDVDVADDGTIYAIEDKVCYEPPRGLEGMATPYMADSLVALSPDGELLREPVSLISAFDESPYAALLGSLEEPDTRRQAPFGSTAPQVNWRMGGVPGMNDATHTNCVRVLRSELAAQFPMFRAGQVLVSLRSPNTIALVNPLEGRVVWAARGPWLAQHDPQFLVNGHLLIFDNLGWPRGSRVLEYDPQTQAIPWSYSGTVGSRFYTSERGMCQRLPNGNTFIVVSESGQMMEVTPDAVVVWSYTLGRFIASARRYQPDQLLFLGPDKHVRP
jgi:hypothetical protein